MLGDVLFADVNRANQLLGTQLMGPTVGALNDLIKLTAGNAQQLVQGKNTQTGREGANALGRYTPVLSSMWYLRQAYRRVFLDQLQYLVDPEAHKNFREQEQKLRTETKQGMWWRPGEITPARAPALP